MLEIRSGPGFSFSVGICLLTVRLFNSLVIIINTLHLGKKYSTLFENTGIFLLLINHDFCVLSFSKSNNEFTSIYCDLFSKPFNANANLIVMPRDKSVNGVCHAGSHLTAPATWRKNHVPIPQLNLEENTNCLI